MEFNSLFRILKQTVNRSRMAAAFVLNLISILLLDLLINYLVSEEFALGNLIVSVDYAPEVWLALLALVLGTLIIVISIASQNIAKLIDLYMGDWISLLYIWFIVLATFHIVVIYDIRPASYFLNINILLLTAFLLSFPYIFYILRLTKPENIINRIHRNAIEDIKSLSDKRHKMLLYSDREIQKVQKRLFDALNQLDDLLSYIQFKETRSKILEIFSDILKNYLIHKYAMPKNITKITPIMKSDISFRTMVESFKDLTYYTDFFEKKCFRILGNGYASFIEKNEYELASLCASEMVIIGQTAIKMKFDDILYLILIHYNTFFRFAFKHALKANEQRNLYNLVYHYQLFLEKLAQNQYSELLIKSFNYLQYYGNECFKNAAKANLYFIVDTISFEMKKILVSVYEKEFEMDVQKQLLDYFLKVDKPPEFIGDEIDEQYVLTSKVRMVQASAGFFYLKNNEMDFVNLIILDMLDDVKVLGREKFTILIDKLFFLLKVFEPTFWEDTDRGNINIYYTEHKDYIDPFKELLYKKMKKEKLKKNTK